MKKQLTTSFIAVLILFLSAGCASWTKESQKTQVQSEKQHRSVAGSGFCYGNPSTKANLMGGSMHDDISISVGENDFSFDAVYASPTSNQIAHYVQNPQPTGGCKIKLEYRDNKTVIEKLSETEGRGCNSAILGEYSGFCN